MLSTANEGCALRCGLGCSLKDQCGLVSRFLVSSI